MKQIHLELALLIVTPFVLFFVVPRYFTVLHGPSGNILPDQNPPELRQPLSQEVN